MTTDLGEHVMELQAEVDTHATRAAAAADVGAIAALDGPHRTAALGVLTKLDEMVKHMGTCMNSSNAAPDMMTCKDAMAKLKTATEAHATTMAGIAGLTEARAEEVRHSKEMADQLALMKTHRDELASGAAMYMCTDDSMGTGH